MGDTEHKRATIEEEREEERKKETSWLLDSLDFGAAFTTSRRGTRIIAELTRKRAM